MHRSNYMHLAQSGMSNLLLRQRSRDHAHHASAAAQSRIRQRAHQPDVASAIHQRDAALRQQTADLFCSQTICRTSPKIRPTKNTKCSHDSILPSTTCVPTHREMVQLKTQKWKLRKANDDHTSAATNLKSEITNPSSTSCNP